MHGQPAGFMPQQNTMNGANSSNEVNRSERNANGDFLAGFV